MEIDLEFQKMIDLYLESIKTRVEELMKEAIESEIYDAYTPVDNGYQRTYTFLNSVKAHINPEGNIYLYVDINEGSQYYSVVDGSPQFLNIGNFIEGGHRDSTGYGGEYHNYSPRLYLEKASELITKDFPELNVQIIK